VSSDELEAYLERELTPPDPGQLAALEASPIDPAAVLALADVERLLDPAPVPVETGWCLLGDGVAYVAAATAMPGVNAEMVDWWFDWHPRDPLRYRIWHPLAHRSNSLEEPRVKGAKPHWGAVHHPVEDVGTGVVHARICFRDPSELGLSAQALARPEVATVLAAYVGDDRMHMRHSVMFHVFLHEPGGLLLRSRFWLGAAIRPFGPAGALGEPLLNRPPMRRRMLPASVPRALARHCLEEYANLAALLPEIYARFGPQSTLAE
jgi:hypothetical protein